MPTEAAALRFGLTEATIHQIHGVFASHPQIERVVIYGSRAMGHPRVGSDIDLTLMSETLSYDELLQIEVELDDLLLPYKIDLSLHRQIDNPDLLAHIARVGRVFYPSALPSSSPL